MPCRPAEELLHHSEHQQLWRYVDLSKFVDLLANKALFFPRSDRFLDPREGILSELNAERRYGENSDIPEDRRTDVNEAVARVNKALLRHTYVSCWHANDGESAAMWDLYAHRDQGLALVTSVSRLKEALADAKPEILLGSVEYVDYAQQPVRERETHAPFFFKRQSFAHEAEVRAVVQPFPTRSYAEGDLAPKPKIYVYRNDGWSWLSVEDLEEAEASPGMHLPVDLQRLIQEVRVSPLAPSWFQEVIDRTIRQFGFTFPIVKSTLYEIG